MSRRLPPEADDSPDPPDAPEPELAVAESDELDDEEDVEYFVEVVEDCWVRTSVPNSAQSAHTSSSAPSILTVVGEPVSVPHISH